MFVTALLVAILAVNGAILVIAGAILVAVKAGFNQSILGLQSIYEQRSDTEP